MASAGSLAREARTFSAVKAPPEARQAERALLDEPHDLLARGTLSGLLPSPGETPAAALQLGGLLSGA